MLNKLKCLLAIFLLFPIGVHAIGLEEAITEAYRELYTLRMIVSYIQKIQLDYKSYNITLEETV